MNYAPQEWLADFGILTNTIRRANEMDERIMIDTEDIDALSSDVDQEGVSELVKKYTDPSGRVQYRYNYNVRCTDCGELFKATTKRAVRCPKCRSEFASMMKKEYIERHNRRADIRKLDAQDAKDAKNTQRQDTVLVNRSTEPRDMSPSDVPSNVPSDVYATAAEKEKKTAPIRTNFGPYKPETTEGEVKMDMSKFPSLINRTEHPEVFDVQEDVQSHTPTYIPADNGSVCDAADTQDMPYITAEQAEAILKTAIKADRKTVIMSLYSAICDIAGDGESVSDVLERLKRVDAALS